MTNVINFNYLNFDIKEFWPKGSVQDYGFDNGRKYHDDSNNRIIDVTAHSRVLNDNEKAGKRVYQKSSYKTSDLFDPSLVAVTYDRNGKIVRSINARGVKINTIA